jgi:hypothetical protein
VANRAVSILRKFKEIREYYIFYRGHSFDDLETPSDPFRKALPKPAAAGLAAKKQMR